MYNYRICLSLRDAALMWAELAETLEGLGEEEVALEWGEEQDYGEKNKKGGPSPSLGWSICRVGAWSIDDPRVVDMFYGPKEDKWAPAIQIAESIRLGLRAAEGVKEGSSWTLRDVGGDNGYIFVPALATLEDGLAGGCYARRSPSSA